MARSGALLIGADHRDLMTAPQGLSRQGTDAISEDAIVITDQDPHSALTPGLRLRGLKQAST
jgi:hypothetical protein